MTERQEKIKRFVEEAIGKFNEHEQYLIKNDLSERCICAKYMSHLERVIEHSDFKEYKVDVEYNRGNNGRTNAVKELRGQKIVVDLIVHMREPQEDGSFDNLVCVEMKKAYKRIDMSNDIARLRNMTSLSGGFNYQAGFMIVADKCNNENMLRIEREFYYGEEHN